MQAAGKPFPGLPASIAAVQKGCLDRPDLHSLAWVLCPRLPGKPRTSANLKTEGACSRLSPLEDVILSDPWLGMNTECAINIIFVDSDRPDFQERLAAVRDAGVTITYAARGKVGGHAAIITETPVVTGIRSPEQDRAMLRKMSLTHSLLITAFNGDRSAGLRGMTKNPFHPRWATNVYDLTPQSLDDILIPLQAMAKAEGWRAPRRRYKGDRKREPSPDGRNCALFDLVRWWAADACERDGSAIMARAEEVNSTFNHPLSHAEVNSLARSITRFMMNRYDGRGRHVPLPPEEVKARQKKGRQARGERQRSDRNKRLVEAVQRILSRGGEAGQQAVAEEAGVSLRTVQSAWSELYRFVNNPQPAVPLSGSSAVGTGAVAVPPPSQLPEAPVPASPPSNIIRLSDLARGSQSAAPPDWSPEGVKRRQRQDSKRRCAERVAAHRAAERGGVRAYRDWVAARYAALFRERKRAIEAAEDWPVPDDDVDPIAVWAARERLADSIRITRMGWAAKLKAEDRISRRIDDELQEQERQQPRPRLRTHFDAFDRVAVLIPDSSERLAGLRIQQKQEIRRERAYTVV